MNTFTVKIKQTAELDEAARDEVIRVCIDAHQKEEFKDLFSYISDGRHFLGCLDDKLICHAVVTTRWLQPENMPLLKTAYVDAVSTSTAHQGQGYASAVMRSLAANITDYEIGCLETTDKMNFYMNLGWELWRGRLAGRSDEGLIPTPEQTGIMILRLPTTPELNLDSLLTIEVSGRIW
jgi:aminoglycoside 2'-N-acetyltransferase I